jgi:hypothetical protein
MKTSIPARESESSAVSPAAALALSLGEPRPDAKASAPDARHILRKPRRDATVTSGTER